MTALAHEIPLVCVPGDRRAPNTMRGKDQPAIATRVEAACAGLYLAPDAASSQIRAAVERVLSEESFRAAERGADRAADEIEALVTSRTPNLVGTR